MAFDIPLAVAVSQVPGPALVLERPLALDSLAARAASSAACCCENKGNYTIACQKVVVSCKG